MKKVLLLDPSVATINIGDEIIKYSIYKNYPEMVEGNYIYNLPTHTKTFSWLQKKLYPERMQIYYNADYKFFCGTNALYVNMLRPMPTWNINILNYDLYKDTILLGVGLGINAEKINTYTKLLYKKTLSTKYTHSVRDEKTKLFLEHLDIPAINTGCPSLWGLTKEHCANIPQNKSDSVIFTLTSYDRDSDNDQAMIDILIHNYLNVYFWPQSIDDVSYLFYLKNTENVRIVPPNIKAYEEILCSNIDYVGNRLHGGIFAIQHGCRSIIISIDYRAEEMANNYSFTCIPRRQIKKNLEELIQSEWKTEITGLDFGKIEQWKRQFFNE